MFLKSLTVLLSLASILVAQSNNKVICNNTAVDTSVSSLVYALREGSRYCYRFFDTPQTFSSAERICRNDNAFLLRIASEEENNYINATYSQKNDFWIGLNDKNYEGVFVWSDGEDLDPLSFQLWVGGTAAATNGDSFDCVKFTPQGWIVHQGYCETSTLPFACRSMACNSTDGVTCDSSAQSSSISGWVIAVIVVVPLVILFIVAIVVFLLIMWKFQNDIFNKYICFCSFGNSKAQVNTLKQEVQRLQTELSQHKLNSSGRFSSFSKQPMTSQVSLPLNRSFSSNTIVPINVVPTSRVRPSMVVRGNSTVGLPMKSSLPPLSEEKKPLEPTSIKGAD